MYYIYFIEDPLAGPTLYVGISKNPKQRFKQHLATNKRLRETIRELEKAYGDKFERAEWEPYLSIGEEVKTLEEARRLEIKYIKKYKPLLNRQNNQEGIYQLKIAKLENKIYSIIKKHFPESVLSEQSAWEIAGEIIDLIKGMGE